MCFGLEAGWIPAAVSAATAVGGTAAAARQNRAQVEEQNRKEQAERLRQREFQSEADTKLAEVLQQFDPTKGQAEVKAAQEARAAAMVPAATAPTPIDYGAPVTAAAPKEIVTQADRKVTEAKTKGGDEALRLALIQAFGDVPRAQDVALKRGAHDIGNIANASARSASLLGPEYAQAMKKGGNSSQASDVSNTISQIASMYGATRHPSAQGKVAGRYGAVEPFSDPWNL